MASEAIRVLTIEDDAVLRDNMAVMFESQGHVTLVASDGRSGVVLAMESRPDVVILELSLPGLDGLRVCEQLRMRAKRHVPILMSTARDTLDEKLRRFFAGADDHLTKPFARAELLAR